MQDEAAEEIVGNISEMALGLDPDDMNTQWVEGYQQACRDIVLMACRVVNKHRSITEGLPDNSQTL